MKHEFTISRTTNPKEKPDVDKINFGTVFTDHMFIMNYTQR